MASRTKSRKSDRGDGHSLKQRPVPFIALLFAVPATWTLWLVLWFLVRNDIVQRALWTGIIVAFSCLLTLLTYARGKHRETVVRWHVTVSVLLAGLAGAFTVAIGVPDWWMIAYGAGGIGIAISWMIPRLDALRRDQDDEGNSEDDLKNELGLKNVKFGKPELHYDKKTGKLDRIEVDTRHVRGDTVESLQNALGKLESVANAPRGASAAIGGDTADRSHLTLIMRDILKNMVPYPGPSAPGAWITEPIVDSMYEDHQPGMWYLAGNHPEAVNPASVMIMGMTRTGKTQLAQVGAMEMFTRRGIVIFWFDTVKGAQTVAPLREGFDIVVADEGAGEEGGDPKLFRAGMKALIRLIKWRAMAMGQCGYRNWSPAVAEDPRLRMPFIYAHFEEADTLADLAGEDMIFLGSKGLSTGVAVGFSLQRADANSMPTGLRFNLGTRSCFGCGDDYSAGFALTDGMLKEGAHPEEWGQTRPGYFYRLGIGIDRKRWARTLKGMFATDGQMAAHTAEWAPRMDKLDDGSIAVLGEWYQEMKRIMASADPNEVVPAMPLPVPGPNGNGRRPTYTLDEEVDDEEIEMREIRDGQAATIAEMRASGEIEPDPEIDDLDPSRPLTIPRVNPEDEVILDEPPEAPSPEAAAEAFDRALRAVAADTSLHDRTGTAVFMVGDLVDRYPFRSRSWFSTRLSDLVEGKLVIPPGLALDRGEKTGQYRIRIVERQPIDVSR
jgi:hypothetical protein